jgi:hypothetical protein
MFDLYKNTNTNLVQTFFDFICMSYYWIGTGTSITSGRVKLVLWTQTSPLSEVMRHASAFQIWIKFRNRLGLWFYCVMSTCALILCILFVAIANHLYFTPFHCNKRRLSLSIRRNCWLRKTCFYSLLNIHFSVYFQII